MTDHMNTDKTHEAAMRDLARELFAAGRDEVPDTEPGPGLTREDVLRYSAAYVAQYAGTGAGDTTDDGAPMHFLGGHGITAAKLTELGFDPTEPPAGIVVVDEPTGVTR